MASDDVICGGRDDDGTRSPILALFAPTVGRWRWCPQKQIKPIGDYLARLDAGAAPSRDP